MISVIIPTYNRAHLISRAIESIQRQYFKDWELIIVDDGSTDNTDEIIKPFLEDHRIHYKLKNNSGAADSRNVGVKYAKFEFITFLDSDDEAHSDWLKEYAELISNKKAKVVCCGMEKLDENGKIFQRILPSKIGKLFPAHIGQFTNGGTYLLKKSIFEDIGEFDAELKSGQHTELSIRLIPYLDKLGIPIFNIYKTLIKIHIHSGDRIRYNTKSKYLGAKRTLEKHLELFSSRKDLKSVYEGIVAVNASKSGFKKDARRYAKKSFQSDPNFKSLLRFIKIYFRAQ